MEQGTLGAADVRRVGYGLEVGRIVRTAGGAGHIVSPRAQLVHNVTSLITAQSSLHTQCHRVVLLKEH